MNEPIEEENAKVVFSGGNYAGASRKGAVLIMDGWVYLYDEEEYHPKRHVKHIAREDVQSDNNDG